MKSTRSCDIEKKVFSKDNLTNIARFVYKESDFEVEDSKNNRNFRLKINCLDNISYESNNLEPFEESDIINRKKIESIYINFTDFINGKEIDLMLTEGNNKLNHLRVSGDNSDWVASNFHGLTELIGEVKPQTNFILKNKKLFSFFSSLILSVLSIITIVLFLYNLTKFGFITLQDTESTSSSRSMATVNILMFTGLLTIIWNMKVKEFIDSLWFSVEFDFGPHHLQKQKNVRKAINTFIVIFGIPLFFYILSIL
ncbi:hypothetical protein B4083_1871 [Bacillus cereus]|nr:hypothetical protein B4083_1871 [Bacillus cereus]